MSILVIILLVVLVLGLLPVFPHSANYGYSPAFLIVIILIVLLATGTLG